MSQVVSRLFQYCFQCNKGHGNLLLPRQQNDHFWTSRNWSCGCPLDVGCSSYCNLRTSVDPKMVQILTVIFKTLLKKLIFIKVLDNYLYTQKA